MNNACANHVLHGRTVCRNAPAISHLLFTDDSLLFCRATTEEGQSLKTLLDDYKIVSGQAINYSNSGIYFSNNVGEERRQELSDIIGVHQALNTGRYLSLPSLVGRSKHEIFSYIKNRLSKKLQGWRNKKLSKAGKEVLIKAAVQAIPTYCMMTFLLPSTLLDELQLMLNKFWWGDSSDKMKGIKWMRWEKLCVNKSMGGRGFKDLHLFNISILGKMAWRLISEPNALVCQLLRAKYFPNGDFLKARLGGNPSYTWTSILTSQDLIRDGLRWKVGDGRLISVWTHSWVRDPEDPYVRSLCPAGYEDMKVQELINEDTGTWDEDQLSFFLNPNDRARVLNTALPPWGARDRQVWSHDRSGNYTVETGYNRAATLAMDYTLEVEGRWNLLWGLKVPPNVRDCLWRMGRDCLSHKVNLYQKRVVQDKWCVLCGEQLEDTWHVFFNCRYALECWDKAGLRDILETAVAKSETLLDVFFLMLADQGRNVPAKFGMLAWQIWKERNSMVWDNCCKNPTEAVFASASLLLEWLQAIESRERSKLIGVPLHHCQRWHPPPDNCFKIKTDATFFRDSGRTGIGLVHRDWTGKFVGARTLNRPGYLEVEVGEAWGFYEAILWAKNLGIEDVIIEGDAKLVVDVINSGTHHESVFGDFIRASVELLASFNSYTICFVKRDANILAHDFARSSILYGSSFGWTNPPNFVDGHSYTYCLRNNMS